MAMLREGETNAKAEGLRSVNSSFNSFADMVYKPREWKGASPERMRSLSPRRETDFTSLP